MEKEKLKNRIISTARKKFLQNGYKNTKTDILAKEIGISKRTLYESFSSKKMILEEIIQREIDSHLAELEAIVNRLENDENANFFEELKKLWNIHSNDTYHWKENLMIEIQTLHPDLWEKISNFNDKDSKKHFKRLLEAGKKSGKIKKHIDIELIFMLEMGFFRHVMTPEKVAEMPYSIKELVAKTYEIIFTGILTKHASKELKEKFKDLGYKD